jgi:hypothetical protein
MATAGADLQPTGSGTLNFARGCDTTNDPWCRSWRTLDEVNRDVHGQSGRRDECDDRGSRIGTITDNDLPPSLTIHDVTVNENAGTATFT